MEFFDYDKLDHEYDRILEEAEPCEDCLSTDYLALAVITELENHGTIILFCTNCHVDNKEELNNLDHETTRNFV